MDKEELIAKHFAGTLNPAEKIELEQLLKEDADLAQEIYFGREIKKAFAHNKRKELKAQVVNFEKKRSWPWYAAASIIIVIGLSYLFVFKPADTTILYTTNFQPYPNTVYAIVRGEKTENLEAEAFENYDQENYANASELFARLYLENHTDYALFYQGISLMAINQHSKALVVFEQIPEASKYPKSWYQALCYLKLKQPEEAKKFLQETAKKESPLQEKAKHLLITLN